MVAPGWVRLQILNASNARGLLLGFQDPHADNKESLVPFHLLGTDGGLLAAPRALDRVFLHGAERVDVAIDVTGRRELQAVSVEFDARHHTQGAAPRHRHPARERYAPLAQESVCENGSPPRQGIVQPMARSSPSSGLRVEGCLRAHPGAPGTSFRAFGTRSAPNTPTRRIRLDFDERTGFLIDQTPYAIDETGFSVTRGAREVWEIKNSPISMPHPMHVHGFGFRVLRRQGTFGAARKFATEPGGRFPTDLGIKDTVLAWPNETLWLALDFTLPRDAAA